MIKAADGSQPGAVVPCDLTAAFLQRCQNLLSDTRGAESIQQNLYTHVLAAAVCQDFSKPAADFTIPENVSFDCDGSFCMSCGFQHCGIKFFAVIQQRDAVVRYKGNTGS